MKRGGVAAVGNSRKQRLHAFRGACSAPPCVPSPQMLQDEYACAACAQGVEQTQWLVLLHHVHHPRRCYKMNMRALAEHGTVEFRNPSKQRKWEEKRNGATMPPALALLASGWGVGGSLSQRPIASWLDCSANLPCSAASYSHSTPHTPWPQRAQQASPAETAPFALCTRPAALSLNPGAFEDKWVMNICLQAPRAMNTWCAAGSPCT